MDKKKISIKDHPIILSQKEVVKCVKNHCTPDEKTIADNYKHYLDTGECIKKASNIKNKSKKKKALKVCFKNDKYDKILDEHDSCVSNHCSKEIKARDKIIGKLEEKDRKIFKKLIQCEDKNCKDLIEERKSIMDKCNKLKDYGKYLDCKDNSNIDEVNRKIKECTNEKCTELKKAYRYNLKKSSKIFDTIYIQANKKEMEREKKIYEKYYKGGSTLKNNKATITVRKNKLIKKTKKRKNNKTK